MSTLRAILCGIWRGLDGLRKILHLLLLLAIFGAVIWAVSSLDAERAVSRRPGRRARGAPGRAAERRSGAAGDRERPGAAAAGDAAVGSGRRPSAPRPATAASACWCCDLDDMQGAGQPELEELAERHPRLPRQRQAGHRLRHGLRSGPVLPRGPGRQGLSRSDRLRDDRGLQPLSALLQGPAAEARRRHQRLPRRHLQERGGDLHPQRHVAGRQEAEPGLPRRALVDLPEGGDGGAQAAGRRHRQLRRLPAADRGRGERRCGEGGPAGAAGHARSPTSCRCSAS